MEVIASPAIFTLQLVCCAIMVGVIWVIQLLHYPAFEQINSADFVHFHRRHSRNISFIVMPVMLAEVVSGGLLILSISNRTLFVANFFGILLLWICTFFFSVPLHNRLSQGSHVPTIQRLVLTNWPRTIIWTVRLVGLFAVSL